MPKIILIFVLALSNLLVSDLEATKEFSPSIEFTDSAIDFESGQPVFDRDVHAILHVPEDGVQLIINDKVDIMITKDEIDLNSLIELSDGTYTVVIKDENQEEAFGFTIR